MTASSFASPTPDDHLRSLAENLLAKPKVLQDVVLIPVPEYLLAVSHEACRRSPLAQAALGQWEQLTREDDLCFGLEERRWIPRIEIYLPNTPEGDRFLQVAQAIGSIPVQAGIRPKNLEQGYWLKTLHYFYQARGVLLAHKLLGMIPNPLSKGGVLREHLSEQTLTNLDLITEVDVAEYRLIEAGQCYLKSWLLKHQTLCPFQTLWELFLELQKQTVLAGWESGPNNKGDWIAIDDQKDLLAVQVRLLQKSPWLERINRREAYRKRENEYLGFLQENGWYGRLVLALRPHSESFLATPWNQYVQALKKGKSAHIDDFYWRGGLPYKRREREIEPTLAPCSSVSRDQCECPFREMGTDLSASNCLTLARSTASQTQKTAERVRVRGRINLLGYLIWIWA